MCGLVGYCGSVKPDLNAIKILGIANVSRGKHSCGIAVNNSVYKGTGKDSEFSDYIKKFSIEEPKNNYNVIVHTRHATFGAHTVENAHPFAFVIRRKKGEKEQKEADFIGAHNGSLEWGWKYLLTKKGIKQESLMSVDSKALLFRIFSDRNTDVLKEYKGDAALLFMHKAEPNVLFAWKGAAGDVEERPLYYVQVKNTKGNITGVYLSSIEDSLNVMTNHKYTVKEVPNNTLIKFNKGEIEEETLIERDRTLGKNYSIVKHNNPTPSYYGYDEYEDYYDNLDSRAHSNNRPYDRNNKIVFSENNKNSSPINTKTNRRVIDMNKKLNLEPPKSHSNGRVIYKYFRYWYNGHLMEGHYNFERNTGKVIHNINNEKLDPNEVYSGFFVLGVRMYNKEVYKAISKIQQPNVFELSQGANDPICSIRFSRKDKNGIESLGSSFFIKGESYLGTDDPIYHVPEIGYGSYTTVYMFSEGDLKEMMKFFKSKSSDGKLLVAEEFKKSQEKEKATEGVWDRNSDDPIPISTGEGDDNIATSYELINEDDEINFNSVEEHEEQFANYIESLGDNIEDSIDIIETIFEEYVPEEIPQTLLIILYNYIESKLFLINKLNEGTATKKIVFEEQKGDEWNAILSQYKEVLNQYFEVGSCVDNKKGKNKC